VKNRAEPRRELAGVAAVERAGRSLVSMALFVPAAQRIWGLPGSVAVWSMVLGSDRYLVPICDTGRTED